MEVFDSSNGIPPQDWAVPMEQDFVVETDVAEDETRWAELVDVNARVSFNIAWSGLSETEASAIWAFFQGRKGGLESFLWTPPFLGYGQEAYGFAAPLSWSRIGDDEYNLTTVLARRPTETV